MQITQTERDIKHAIAAAFRDLRAQGYLARQNYRCCMGCALADHAVAMAKTPTTDRPKGLVYFHRQDGEHERLATGRIMVRFSTNGDESDSVAASIGKAAAEALHRAGLKVEWDGTADTAIEAIV